MAHSSPPIPRSDDKTSALEEAALAAATSVHVDPAESSKAVAAALASPSRHDIAEAYAALGKVSRYARMWIADNSRYLQALGRALLPDESVAAVGVGQTGMGIPRGIVLTTHRTCVIGSGGPDWIPNADLQNVRSMLTIRGQCLSFRSTSRRKNFSFWETQPKGFAGQVSHLIKYPGAMASYRQTPTTRKSTAKFLGGEFHGNVLAAAPPIPDRATVKISCDGATELHIAYAQDTIARYPLDYPGLTIDTSDTVGRGIRKGRLVTVAAAHLLLTPLALAATPLATARRPRRDYAIAIEDTRDFGIFAITDSSFGAWVAAARSKSTGGTGANTAAMETPTAEIPPSDDDALTKARLDLLQLKNLHDDGLISDEEYSTLRKSVVNGLSAV